LQRRGWNVVGTVRDAAGDAAWKSWRKKPGGDIRLNISTSNDDAQIAACAAGSTACSLISSSSMRDLAAGQGRCRRLPVATRRLLSHDKCRGRRCGSPAPFSTGCATAPALSPL